MYISFCEGCRCKIFRQRKDVETLESALTQLSYGLRDYVQD